MTFLKVVVLGLLLTPALAQSIVQGAPTPATGVQTSPPKDTTNIKIPALSPPTISALVNRTGPAADVLGKIKALTCANTSSVTAFSIKNKIAIFTGVNDFSAKQQIRILGLKQGAYLNNVPLTLLSSTPATFTATFNHEDVPPTGDRGTAVRADCLTVTRSGSTTFSEIPSVPSGTHATNYRSGQQADVFSNNSYNYREHLGSLVGLYNFDVFVPIETDAHYNTLTVNQPSYSWGNNGGWGVQKNSYDEIIFNSRGIAQTRSVWCEKHAVGDAACGDYLYGFTDGGQTAQSDEGFTMDTREGGESDQYFHGTVGANAFGGVTLLPVVFTSGQNSTTDGAFMLDISRGTISGTVTGPDAIVDGTSVHTLPVTANLPTSSGIGIINTPLPVIAVANVPESIAIDVSLTHGSFNVGLACLAGGWYPEQVSITQVSTPNGTSQTVTLTHKNPNPSASTDPNNPSSLWQGGVCGNYLSLDRNLARDGFRTSYPIVGATDPSHLAYVWNVGGSVRANGLQVYLQPTSLSNLTRKNGVVTASFANSSSSFIYNHAPSVVIAGASDPSFNGTVSSPVYTNGQNYSLSWQQAGPDSTAASATIDLPPDYYGFHLYPGAEVLAPQNAGGVPLEPNSVPWTPGDSIENPHNPSFIMNYRMTQVTQHTLPNGGDSNAEMWGFHGAGISNNFRPSTWINNNPCNLYVGCGGTLEPIIWTIHRGPYSVLHSVESAPMNGGALFNVGCDSNGCDHPGPYALFNMQNGRIVYDPTTSTVNMPNLSIDTLTAKAFNTGAITVGKLNLPDSNTPANIFEISNTAGTSTLFSHNQGITVGADSDITLSTKVNINFRDYQNVFFFGSYVQFPNMGDSGTHCLGLVNHNLVPGIADANGNPCVTSITWTGGNGLAVQQAGYATQPTYTIVPESGYFVPTLASKTNWDAAYAATVPSTTPATITSAEANPGGTATCATGYTCTAGRGRITVAAGSGSTSGRIAHVAATLAAGQICTATQNGGAVFLGIGSNSESGAGFDISAGVALTGSTTVDYFCR